MVWDAGSDLNSGIEGLLAGGAGKAARASSKDDLPHTLRRGMAFVVSNNACLRRGLGGVGGEGVALFRPLHDLGVGESRKGN
jgi:hypothetical protein